jgi:outer membrane protein insertion porin family
VGYPIFEFTRLFLGYSFEDSEVSDIAFNATSLLFREDVRGAATTSSVSPSIVRDTRNDRLEPTAGSLFSIGFDGAGLGGDNDFTKVGGFALDPIALP